MSEIDLNYWENRYQEENTGWDIGYPAPPLQHYFDQLTDKSISIVIPGCGRAYEAEYLFNNGFRNVHLIDGAPSPLAAFKARVPEFPDDQLHCEDFFEHDGRYDLMMEQTFFCAIEPHLREDYVQKALALLKPGGKLMGLLFNEKFSPDGPPWGGHKEEYLPYFEPYFDLRHFEIAHNSIEPRQGRELFILLVKKSDK